MNPLSAEKALIFANTEIRKSVKVNHVSWDKWQKITKTFVSQSLTLSCPCLVYENGQKPVWDNISDQWDGKFGQNVPEIFKYILRNARAIGTIGQLLYIPSYINKKKSIYKKNREIGLANKQIIQGVRKPVFFCPFVPSSKKNLFFSSDSAVGFLQKVISEVLRIVSEFCRYPFEYFGSKFYYHFFTNFGLPVFSELNPEFCSEVIS